MLIKKKRKNKGKDVTPESESSLPSENLSTTNAE